MEGGLIDGKTLRKALGVMTSGQGMVLLGRLAGLSEAEMAEEIGVRESDVAWFMGLARDEVARRAPEAEALIDARGTRESAGHELVLEAWRAAWAARSARPRDGVLLGLQLGQAAGEVVTSG